MNGRVFRFKSFPWLCAWLVAMEVGCLALAMSVITRDREATIGEFAVIAIFAAGLATIGGLTILGNSDIVVDDHAISRRILGKTWQYIRWDNVQRIREFHIPSFEGGSFLRAFQIYPRTGPRFRWFSGKMAFTERSLDIRELPQTITGYAIRYGIPVEREAPPEA